MPFTPPGRLRPDLGFLQHRPSRGNELFGVWQIGSTEGVHGQLLPFVEMGLNLGIPERTTWGYLRDKLENTSNYLGITGDAYHQLVYVHLDFVKMFRKSPIRRHFVRFDDFEYRNHFSISCDFLCCCFVVTLHSLCPPHLPAWSLPLHPHIPS